MSGEALYRILNADIPVKALLGTNPLRVYAFGQAPADVAAPYLVWQVISGSPENNLSQTPDFDYTSTQIDIYAKTSISATNVKNAVRDAIEQETNITSWGGESRDTPTNLYRITFSVDWFTRR